ncbi:DUF2897 family protein [Pseudoalteromonas sp. APC 3356]|jgi:hypothetical protein|nr:MULTISPECIES: DUF2897 family protein [unclassified Pseudoalteromonas]ADT68824.1 hypothetical protein PSM_A1900 [Pseudoalteromonas sp. SM9913]MBL1383203.1 DUF2897 family protein [Colwellia sp.]MDN3432848.1 DUF2897 family protein [Pseudoalteromonas sp. APC 3356]PHQ91351.1 MAG: DUF2897 domain-containing protein [Pseudoalteromonas sp.]
MQIWQIVLVIVIVLAIVIGNLVLLRLSAKSEFNPSAPRSSAQSKETKKP